MPIFWTHLKAIPQFQLALYQSLVCSAAGKWENQYFHIFLQSWECWGSLEIPTRCPWGGPPGCPLQVRNQGHKKAKYSLGNTLSTASSAEGSLSSFPSPFKTWNEKQIKILFPSLAPAITPCIRQHPLSASSWKSHIFIAWITRCIHQPWQMPPNH